MNELIWDKRKHFPPRSDCMNTGPVNGNTIARAPMVFGAYSSYRRAMARTRKSGTSISIRVISNVGVPLTAANSEDYPHRAQVYAVGAMPISAATLGITSSTKARSIGTMLPPGSACILMTILLIPGRSAEAT